MVWSLLVNAYLSDTSISDKRVNSISLLLKYNGNARFIDIESQIMSWPEYVDSYELIQGQFIMYVLDIPEEFIEDYYLILKGKYSEISPEAKQLLMIGRAVRSPMPYILNKSDYLKDHWEEKLGTSIGDLDVWSIFNIEEEIFDLETFPIKPSLL